MTEGESLRVDIKQPSSIREVIPFSTVEDGFGRVSSPSTVGWGGSTRNW